ncbi:MAG: toprim domain-containing protein [Chloroflexi bacterium]|nr:toprim domain-containing protein [Chloroflexota bacterium]
MYGHVDMLERGADIISREPPPPIPPPSMEDVHESARRLDDEVLAFLGARGIRPDTARRYLIGRDEHAPKLTIPNVIVNSPPRCVGIKKRWLYPPPEDWIPTYTAVPGTKGSSIFNWNRLISKVWDYLLIVEAPLDVILLDQLGIPAVAPFGGGGVWDRRWTKCFKRVKDIIIVADHDPPNVDKETGEVLGQEPGMAYAEVKKKMLGRGIITYPEMGKDIGEAFLHGTDLHRWIKFILEEKNGTNSG